MESRIKKAINFYLNFSFFSLFAGLFGGTILHHRSHGPDITRLQQWIVIVVVHSVPSAAEAERVSASVVVVQRGDEQQHADAQREHDDVLKLVHIRATQTLYRLALICLTQSSRRITLAVETRPLIDLFKYRLLNVTKAQTQAEIHSTFKNELTLGRPLLPMGIGYNYKASRARLD